MRAAFGLLEKLTLEPDALDSADVADLRSAGLSEEAIVDVIFVGAGFNVIDRVADALAFFVLPDFRKGAPIVQKLGYWWMSGTWPPAADSGLSNRARKQALASRLEDATLGSPGALDPDLRQRIADERDVPDALRPYVAKVHRHAYKVVDEDVAALQAAGYSEDAILEATLAAALGAGRKRLRAGLAAIAADHVTSLEQT